MKYSILLVDYKSLFPITIFQLISIQKQYTLYINTHSSHFGPISNLCTEYFSNYLSVNLPDYITHLSPQHSGPKPIEYQVVARCEDVVVEEILYLEVLLPIPWQSPHPHPHPHPRMKLLSS